MKTLQKACPTCPYRRDSRAADMPGGFDLSWASEACVGNGPDSTGVGNLLVCHETEPRDPETRALCFGWLYQQRFEGTPNIQLRLAMIRGEVSLPEGVHPELIPTLRGMQKKMEADPDSVGTPKKKVYKIEDVECFTIPGGIEATHVWNTPEGWYQRGSSAYVPRSELPVRGPGWSGQVDEDHVRKLLAKLQREGVEMSVTMKLKF